MRPSSGSRSPQWAGHYESKDITRRKAFESALSCSESRGVRCSTGAPRTAPARRRHNARLVPRPRTRAPYRADPPPSCGPPPEGHAEAGTVTLPREPAGGASVHAHWKTMAARRGKRATHVGTRPSRNSGRPGPSWPTGRASRGRLRRTAVPGFFSCTAKYFSSRQNSFNYGFICEADSF